MINGELSLIASQLEQARSPEDIFGKLDGPRDEKSAALHRLYRQMAKISHPDAYHTREEQLLAQRAFGSLTEWLARAEEKIQSGDYGCESAADFVIQTKKRAYVLGGGPVEGNIYNLYPARFQEGGRTTWVTLKIARDPRDNDLLQNEARVLRRLLTGGGGSAGSAVDTLAKFSAYFPRLIDAFLYQEGSIVRGVNVFEHALGWSSLEQVRKAYPGGVDPKDMAWMWRRLLVGLGFVHANGIIHGAVLPGNVWIQPEQHGLRLDEWSYAVCDPETSGEYIAAMDPDYEGWYPDELINKEIPVFGTDIDLAAKCMIYVLGGDPRQGLIPDSVPGPIRSFLKGTTLPGKRARPQDAWGLKEEFDELLEKLWGERKFHPFRMF